MGLTHVNILLRGQNAKGPATMEALEIVERE